MATKVQTNTSIASQASQGRSAFFFPAIDQLDADGSSPYDYILIGADSKEMLLFDQPTSGTELNLDKHKGNGRDWAHMISKGYKVKPTKINLLLMVDILTGIDYFDRYWTQVHDLLMPISDIKRANAVEVYHPILSGEGITKLVVTSRATPKYHGKQMWVVEIDGFDIRFPKPDAKKKNNTKAVTATEPNFQPAFTLITPNGTSAGASTYVGNPDLESFPDNVSPAAALVGQP